MVTLKTEEFEKYTYKQTSDWGNRIYHCFISKIISKAVVSIEGENSVILGYPKFVLREGKSNHGEEFIVSILSNEIIKKQRNKDSKYDVTEIYFNPLDIRFLLKGVLDFIDKNLNKQEEKNMVSIKESASNYEAPTTRNITELSSVDANLEMQDRTGKDSDGIEFKYKVIVVDGIDYRVPVSVLGNLKAILKENANLQKFKVTKLGEGMNTKYTVIPLG